MASAASLQGAFSYQALITDATRIWKDEAAQIPSHLIAGAILIGSIVLAIIGAVIASPAMLVVGLAVTVIGMPAYIYYRKSCVDGKLITLLHARIDHISDFVDNEVSGLIGENGTLPLPPTHELKKCIAAAVPALTSAFAWAYLSNRFNKPLSQIPEVAALAAEANRWISQAALAGDFTSHLPVSPHHIQTFMGKNISELLAH